MSPAITLSLVEQRQALRRQLQVQRQLIAHQLGLTCAASSGGYPRSMTMRFLARRPDLAARLLVSAAALLTAR